MRLLYLILTIIFLGLLMFNLDACHKDRQLISVQAQGIAASKQMQNGFDQSQAQYQRVLDALQQAKLELLRSRDSTQLFQTLNTQHIEERKRVDKVFLHNMQAMSDSTQTHFQHKIDSMNSQLERMITVQQDFAKTIADTAYTGKIAAASLKSLTGIVRQKSKWIDYEIVTKQTDSGKDTLYILPTIRNSMDVKAELIKEKKGLFKKDRSVHVIVQESNPYMATGAVEYYIPISHPPKKKATKLKAVNHKPKRPKKSNRVKTSNANQ